MTIVTLMGGLGNQMFQYAYARTLSPQNELVLDCSFLKKNKSSSASFTARKFELGIFDLKTEKSNPLKLLLILSENTILRFFKSLLLPKSQTVLVNDENLTQELRHKIIHVNGYFQNPQHFNHLRPVLLREFSFPSLPTGLQKYRDKIFESNAVSLHIRRSDYLKPQLSNIHGVLPLNYYRKAVEMIGEKVPAPVFFVFSDDLDWCKRHLNFPGFRFCYVKSEGYPAWVDMSMMCMCQHHIIANSSFSWWGAWLNDKPDKCVIAPKKWFLSGEMNIVPKEWITL